MGHNATMASVLLDDSLSEPAIPTKLGPRKWSDAVSEVTYNSRSTIGNIRKGTEPSDSTDFHTTLSSSRAEVDCLKEQVAKLIAEQETAAQTIPEAVKQQVSQALAKRLNTVQEYQVSGQQFSLFIQTQEWKFDALTMMFSYMLMNSNQMTHVQYVHQQGIELVQLNAAALELPPTLGKCTAPLDLEAVLNSDRKKQIQRIIPESARIIGSHYRKRPRHLSKDSKLPSWIQYS